MRIAISLVILGALASVARADDDAIVPPGETEPTPVEVAAPAAPPHHTGTFSIGAGFSPDESFIATARIAQDDLFHSGQHLALSAEISMLRERFAIDHVVPHLFGSDLELSTELVTDRRALPGFTREGTGGSIALGYHVSPATRVFVQYRVEQVATTAGDLATSRAMEGGDSMLPPTGDGTIAALGAGISYDTRDGAIPRHGTRFELYGESADPQWGSDNAVRRFSARYDHAEALGPLTLRFSGRGAIATTPSVDGVPRSERLYYAGNTDVRGYAIDPFDQGANAVAVGHLELEAPLWKRAGLSIAGFYDAGVTRNQDPDFGGIGTVVRRSVGASLIWRSPIGPMRFDLAMPLDGTDRTRRLLFWLGGSL